MRLQNFSARLGGLTAAVSCLLLGGQVLADTIHGGNPAAKQGGTLMYEAYEPDHLNPISFRSSGEREVLQNWLFESLVDLDPVTGDNIPLLAKKWEVAQDGKSFTFWLDERAKWADGKPVTAQDVKFSFEVFSKPDAEAAFRKVQAEVFTSISVVSPGVVKFTAASPEFSNFEFIISTLIIPKHVYDFKDKKDLENKPALKQPVGSGPYEFVSWVRGDRMTLKRRANYWGSKLPQNVGAYNFDTIVIRYIRDPQIAFELLKKGEIDYMPIRIGNTELWKQTETSPAFKEGKLIALNMVSKVQSGYGFIAFNLRNDLFKDQALRKALAKAINREELIKKSLAGLARIPYGPLFSADNFAGEFEPVKHDFRGAMKDLTALGWSDSDGDYILDRKGQKLSFTVLVPNARIEKELLFCQNYWKKLGVEVKIKLVEYSTYKDLTRSRNFEAIANGMSRSFLARLVDPYGMWHSDNIGPNLSNDWGYADPRVDKLIVEARAEFDFAKRKKLLDKVNDIVAEDYAMIQYSESSAALGAVNSAIALPDIEGKKWYPYNIGIKYWYRR